MKSWKITLVTYKNCKKLEQFQPGWRRERNYEGVQLEELKWFDVG